MGRRKIEIQPLTDDRNRTVTFVKRKAGLFKKAHELAVLCQVDLAIIIVGNNNKLYEFSSVDTNELIKVYQSTKPHESKSPANYGNYKKKKYVSTSVSINDDLIDDDFDDASDYDSDTPEPKRVKRNTPDPPTNPGINKANVSNSSLNRLKKRPLPPNHISLSNVPTFNSFRNGVIKEEDEEEDDNRHYRNESLNSNSNPIHSRPILRVQIPTDAKGGSDSARTITAIDTNANSLRTSNNASNDSNVNSADNPNHNNSPDSKDLSNGPVINTPKYSNFGTFRSPDTRKPITQLPLPITKSQTSSPSSATAPPLPLNGITSFFGPLAHQSPSSQYPNSSVPTPILSQVYNDNKFRSSMNGPAPGPGTASAPGNHEQPMSGLPSRYVNDIFPSPSNFYVPQDWSSGITPYHNNLPQYFMNMPTMGRQSTHQTPTPSQANPNQTPTQNSTGEQLPQANYTFPSPVQFMGQPYSDKKT